VPGQTRRFWRVDLSVWEVKHADRVFDVGDVEVVIERAELRYWILYFFLGFLAGGSANPRNYPRPPYKLLVRNKASGDALYQDGAVYRGQDAFDMAEDFAKDIKRIGIEEFVFKKSHGWRID
jgi:hypothetical protein